MRRDKKSAQFMTLRRDVRYRFTACHCEDAPFHVDDIVVPCDDRLIAENVGIVDAFRQSGVHSLGHRGGLVDGVEKAERMNFFGGTHLEPAKTSDPRPARTLRNCRGITRRLVIGYRDSAHSSCDSLGDNLCGRHLKTRTGRQAAVYM